MPFDETSDGAGEAGPPVPSGGSVPRRPARARQRLFARGRRAALNRLRAENAALRSQCFRMQRLADSVDGQAIVEYDLEGRITGLNRQARAILGREEGAVLGLSGDVLLMPEERAGGAFLRELCRAANGETVGTERWHQRRDGDRFWASGTIRPIYGQEGAMEGFIHVFADASDIRIHEERQALLLAEMEHRLKNTLAAIQAIASQTLRRADVPEAVRVALAERLRALAHAQDLLLRGGGDGAPLAQIADRVLSPYGGTGRLHLEGPPVLLPAVAVEQVGLAFHELATNAAKHGALSVGDGHVDLRWCLRRGRHGARLVDITWQEHGGPRVEPPTRRGFGSRLLEGGIGDSFGGDVTLDFLPDGVRCHLSLPVSPQREGRKRAGESAVHAPRAGGPADTHAT